MSTRVLAVARPDLPPWEMSDRFRHDIAYFMSISGENEVPRLPEGEYWVRLEDARAWRDDGVFQVVSPLDSQAQTDVELSEEQEAWLAWMIEHEVQHIRIE